MKKVNVQHLPPWTAILLILAAIYNFAWAAWVLVDTPRMYTLWEVAPPLQEGFFPLLGIAVSGMGAAYLLAAFRFEQFGWIAAIGLLNKLIGALGGLFLMHKGWLNEEFIWQIAFNDLLWLPYFALIAYSGFREMQRTELDTKETDTPAFPQILERFTDQQGHPLADIQHREPVMLVFLRHFGCTFCKEMLDDLSKQRQQIEQQGKKLVFVHMGDDERYAQQYFGKYGLDSASRISDPTCQLYQAFTLERANFGQVFGWQSWWRGAYAWLVKGHRVGKLIGDGFRMPGVFVIYQGKIWESFRHQYAAEIPDYQSLMSCPVRVGNKSLMVEKS